MDNDGDGSSIPCCLVLRRPGPPEELAVDVYCFIFARVLSRLTSPGVLSSLLSTVGRTMQGLEKRARAEPGVFVD